MILSKGMQKWDANRRGLEIGLALMEPNLLLWRIPSLREFLLGMILKRDERSCYHGADLGGSRSRGVDKSGISFSVRNPNLNKLSAAATLATAVFYFGYAEFFLKLCQKFCE